jgi:serine/threonine-protein kinase
MGRLQTRLERGCFLLTELEAENMLGQTVLGKYKVVKLLDEGGMSKVYLARQQDIARDAVVKVLKDALLAQPKAREHFQREIHIMSRFAHPNAVAYYDSTASPKQTPLLVMEYLRGVDLNVPIQRQGRLPLERTGRLLAQLCDVLQAAHDAGIVHRDLKPGNLFLLHAGTPQETLKLMDFGLAKMSSMFYISPEEIMDWSLPGAAGTPEYISPEQVRGCDVDARADLYSVGVILFEMLTGRRPYEYESVRDLMLAHADAPIPTFADKGLPADAVPLAVERLVRSCLAKSAEDRPQSPMELITRYEKALGKNFHVGRRAVVPNKPSSPGIPRLTPQAVAAANAFTHSVDATMPEVMAMLKLRGFIADLGGEVTESVPGLIKVRLPDEPSEGKGRGLFGWVTGSAVQTATEVELRMERLDPSQPNRMTITLVMRPATPNASAEWRVRCKRIGQDLQAYLMGR